jgi:GT2 family glycosyltransferase
LYFQAVEPQLSVIIVNYNVKYFLEQCLHSICKAGHQIGMETIVVDNLSSDGSRDYLQPQFPQVKFIWNETNTGFARACNMGLKEARGRYILFLNPDTIVPEDVFKNCIRFFEFHPKAGALGVRMLDGSGKFLKESKRAFPSPSTSFYKLIGLARLFPHSRIFGYYHLGNLSEQETHEIDVLAGAYMMIRKDVLDKVGLFDESFFMYGEDIDLSYRIRQAGYKNYYLGDLTILHFKGESTRKGSLNYVRLFYQAMSIFVNKHYGASRAGLFNFFIQISIGLRAAFSALGRFIRWIGLPALDAALILLSFYGMKILWGDYVLQDEGYNLALLRLAFPVFTLIFLVSAYYAGLYDRPFKFSKLVRASCIAGVVLLAVYSLLPERYRFSRAIVLLTPAVALGLMSILRWLLIQWRVLEKADETGEFKRTLVAGSRIEYERVLQLMHEAKLGKRILGRISNTGGERDSVGDLQHLKIILQTMPAKEIIFCEGEQSFRSIIERMQELERGMRVRIHAAGSNSIVGSDFKDSSGETISRERKFRLAQAGSRRMKRLTDVLLSGLFCLSFPIHFILQKRPIRFWHNVLQVLWGRKTWVGYASRDSRLPALGPAVVACNGFPIGMNEIPEESLQKLDYAYAQDYSATNDWFIVWKAYKNLGAENGES